MLNVQCTVNSEGKDSNKTVETYNRKGRSGRIFDVAGRVIRLL